MDMMEIRRAMMGVIAEMAKGATVIKGSFVTSGDATDYTISFGQELDKYLFLIELSEESKTILMNSDIDANKSFAFIGIYPNLSISGTNVTYNAQSSRVIPHTGVTSTSSISNVICTSSSISNTVRSIADNVANYFYRGLTYNYYVVEIN